MRSEWKIAAIAGGVLLILAMLTGAFGLGLRVGQLRAGVDLVGPRPLPGGIGPGWLGGHGAMGTVKEIDLQAHTLVIANRAGDRLQLQVTEDTIVERLHDRIDISKIQVGEQVVCIGRPDREGRIVARAIRVLGPPDGGVSSAWSFISGLFSHIRRLLTLPFQRIYPGSETL